MQHLMTVIRALGDSNRLRMVMALRGGELCASRLIELLGLGASTVSKHLSVLQQAGLVERRREGRWVFYRLPDSDAAPVVRRTISWLRRTAADESLIQQDAEHLAMARTRRGQPL